MQQYIENRAFSLKANMKLNWTVKEQVGIGIISTRAISKIARMMIHVDRKQWEKETCPCCLGFASKSNKDELLFLNCEKCEASFIPLQHNYPIVQLRDICFRYDELEFTLSIKNNQFELLSKQSVKIKNMNELMVECRKLEKSIAFL